MSRDELSSEGPRGERDAKITIPQRRKWTAVVWFDGETSHQTREEQEHLLFRQHLSQTISTTSTEREVALSVPGHAFTCLMKFCFLTLFLSSFFIS